MELHKVAIVAGSFDPAQQGHIWLIEQATKLASVVIVVISENKNKKHLFTAQERKDLLKNMMDGTPSIDQTRVRIHVVDNKTIARYALTIEATLYVRGVRNGTDFQYEHEMLEVNREINPELETVFMVPPHHLTIVSSSMIKGLVGFDGWEDIANKFTSPRIVTALAEKMGVAKR